jgi:hypothetical protein
MLLSTALCLLSILRAYIAVYLLNTGSYGKLIDTERGITVVQNQETGDNEEDEA